MKSTIPCVFSMFAVLVFLIVPVMAAAQGSYLDEPGIPAFTTAFPVERGFINLANGNLHIEIPIADYPQRGNTKALNARLIYDSRFWIVETDVNERESWAPNGIAPIGVKVGGGFRLITGGEGGNTSFSQSAQQCACISQPAGPCQPQYRTTFTNYAYQEPNGTNHRAGQGFKLYLSPGACGGQQPTGTTSAADDSGFKFVITNGNIAVYAPDGTQVAIPPTGGQPTPPGSATAQDTNGNFFTYTPGQNPAFTNVVDTLGRTPVVTTFSGSQVFLDYLCQPGTSGCDSNNGNRARVTINTASATWTTQFNQTQGGIVAEYSAAGSAVNSIVFPDGSAYQFQQDSYGMITSMTLPTGGVINYGYTNESDYQGKVNRWVTSRTVDGQTWSFAPTQLACSTPPCTQQVAVTTPAYNDGTATTPDTQVYTFLVSNGWYSPGAQNTQAQYFRGSASGSPIVTKTIDYSGLGLDSCPTPNGGSFPLPVRETLTWPTGSGTLGKKAEYCYDGNSNPTTKKMWDYQPNGNFATAPDRETDTTYVTDLAYISANILRLPLTSTSLGPGGVQVAKTTYAYDGGSLQPSNISTSHTTPSGPRGNLTSISKWLNTGGGVTSNIVWFDTGEVYQAIDPLAHTSTFTYDPSFAGAYPTKVCNAVSQCSYKGYDFNTGLLTSFTDANGSSAGDPAHTTTHTYDSMLRPLCSNLPDGGQTCVSYPDPNHIDHQTKITSNSMDNSATLFDDLGRVSETQHTLPNGVSKVDTTYDAVGAVATVTNPYFTTSDPTYGVAQSLHDALGRTVRTIKQDGGVVSAAYSVSASGVNATCVTSTDESGKQRKSCTDALGRLTTVWEDPAGLNYETDYTYDALGNLLQVTQKGDNAANARIRTFTYDSLSRLLTATNPESGKLSYSYDANDNVVLKTSPQANQFSAVASTAVTYCYDALNRVLAKGYALSPNAPQTCSATRPYLPNPAATYTYDAGTNGIGHITSLTDQAGTGSYSYDVIGRVAGESRTINPGGTLSPVTKSMSYLYNLDGSLKTLTYPSGAVITYTPDAAGRMLSAVDAANNINYVTGPAGPNSGSGATYGPDGSILSFTQGWANTFSGIANNFSYNTRLQPINMSAVSPGTTGTSAAASVVVSGTLASIYVLASGTSSLSPNRGSDPGQAVYFDPNGHIVATALTASGSTTWLDLTQLSGCCPAATNSSIATNVSSGGLVYQSADQHIHQIWWWSSQSRWVNNDMTAASGATVAARSGTPLGAWTDSRGVHEVYIGQDNHIYDLFYNSSNGSNSTLDLTTLSGGPGAAANSALTSNVNSGGVVYQSPDGHIHQIWWWSTNSRWVDNDMTLAGGATVAARSGTPVAAFSDSRGIHETYIGQDNHIYDSFYNGSTNSNSTLDLTNLSGGPGAASNSALNSNVSSGGSIVYQSPDGHIHQIWWWSTNSRWVDNDMTLAGGATVAARSGTPLAVFTDSQGIHETYIGQDNHIYDSFYNFNGSNSTRDMTANSPDSGLVSLSIGASFTASACFGSSTNPSCTGKPINSSSSQIAAALAVALNVSGSPVSATLNPSNNSMVNVTWKTSGPFTTPVSALSTTHDSPSLFPNPSFTSSATNFSGGSGANLPVLNLSYDFHLGNGDNGNVFGIANNKDTTRSQTFLYDPLNRLTSAQNAGTDCSQTLSGGKTKFWGNSYGYDAWGNLLSKTVTRCSAENLSVTAGTNNQLQGGYTYDAAGNMTHDATANLNYSFDQENRITGAAGFTYTYDGDGNRVEKSSGSTGTIYWYMSPGIVAESDLAGNLQSEYVFFDGERIARKDFPSNAVSYYFSDHLKTTDIVTDAQGNIKNESDFYPWGGELSFIANDSNHYKFTGKERDSETNLDYFGARYYSNGLGRFITPDWSAAPVPVPYAVLDDPQTLNQYSYVRNIPTSKADANGHSPDWWQKLWNKINYGHAVTDANLNDALKDDAKKALQTMHDRGVRLVLKTGQNVSSDDFLKGKSNQEIVDSYNAYEEARSKGEVHDSNTPPPPVQPQMPGGQNQSTGRTQPNNLKEQLAMEQAQSNPAGGQQIQNIQMRDPRWPASQGWVKMRQNINGIEVHYVRNTVTGAVADFKFAAP